MVAKGIFLSTLRMILQILYPLLVEHQPPISPSPEIPSSPSPPLYSEPDSSRNNQVKSKSNSLEALAGDMTTKLGEMTLKRTWVSYAQIITSTSWYGYGRTRTAASLVQRNEINDCRGL